MPEIVRAENKDADLAVSFGVPDLLNGGRGKAANPSHWQFDTSVGQGYFAHRFNWERLSEL